MQRRAPLVVVSYLTIYLVWGSTYFFIRQSVRTIPPFAVLAMRWTTGGALLAALAAATGRLRRLPSATEILSAAALGTLLLLVGNGLITVAELQVDSYIAALLASSSPIIVALFDRALLGKRLALVRVLGVGLGFAGVALLLYDGRSLAGSLRPPVLIGLAGSVSWSLATSLGHRFAVRGDTLVGSAMQMLFTGVASIIITLAAGHTPASIAAGLSMSSVWGVCYLALFGSVAFVAYTYLLAMEPAERVVSYALVNPVIAIMLGLMVAGETATPLLAVGSPLIVVGLAFMLYGDRLAALAARWRRGRP